VEMGATGWGRYASAVARIVPASAFPSFSACEMRVLAKPRQIGCWASSIGALLNSILIGRSVIAYGQMQLCVGVENSAD
jgi:hypothetical protein